MSGISNKVSEQLGLSSNGSCCGPVMSLQERNSGFKVMTENVKDF